MPHRIFSITFWLLSVAVVLLPAAGADRPPNIVLIMADDIGFECYGAYGSTLYKTPRFDALAREGAQFSHAYSQPVCTPSRVKIMTGKYNFRNYTAFGEMNLSEPTFATMLKKAGYRTAIAGKWQLSPGDFNGPFTAGFDEYCLWHFMDKKRASTDPIFEKKGARFRSPKLFRDGELLPDTEGKYGPDLVTDYICDYMERNKDVPFLVYYPMMLVHAPYEPVPGSVDWGSDVEGEKYFPDMVAYMDKCIGRVVDKLEVLGLRENTLLLVTGDNGTGREITSPLPGRDPIKGGKNSMLDAGTRVGFVASWPGKIAPGTVIDSPIDFADVLPTMAEAAGTTPVDPSDGQSLLPLLQGDKEKARDWIFMSHAKDGPPYRYFVRDTRWKLYDDGSVYDVPQDWLEEHPLTGAAADVVRQRLQPIMDRILASK